MLYKIWKHPFGDGTIGLLNITNLLRNNYEKYINRTKNIPDFCILGLETEAEMC